MDPNREIRLIIPAFFFWVFLGAAFFQMPAEWTKETQDLQVKDNPSLLALEVTDEDRTHNSCSPRLEISTELVVLIVASVLPLGFLISTITQIALWIIATVSGWSLGMNLSKDDLKDWIWPQLSINTNRTFNEELKAWRCLFPWVKVPYRLGYNVSATFDHGVLYNKCRGIHELIMRSYTGAVTCLNSIVAILLTFVSLGFLKRCPPVEWWCVTVAIIIVLIIGLFRARSDFLNILKFQMYRVFRNSPGLVDMKKKQPQTEAEG